MPIPQEWTDEKLILRFLVGPRDGYGSTAETQLYVNGFLLQAIDIWHEEACLPPEYAQLDEIILALRAWNGIYLTPPQRRFKEASLILIDRPTERFYFLTSTLLKAVKHLEQWIKNGYFPPDVNAIESTDADARFGKGEEVFIFNGGWQNAGYDKDVAGNGRFFLMPSAGRRHVGIHAEDRRKADRRQSVGSPGQFVPDGIGIALPVRVLTPPGEQSRRCFLPPPGLRSITPPRSRCCSPG